MALSPTEGRAVAALSIGLFAVQIDFFALSLALPSMAVELNETTTNLQWVLSAYMISIGAAMIPAGRLGDLRGHRRIVVVGLIIFGGASLVCAIAGSLWVLILFRVVQGLGAAALLTVSVALISNAVAEERRAAAIGILFGIANIGTALGPFVGGLLTEQLSWRYLFVINVPLAIVAIVLSLRWLPKSAGGTGVRIDFVGLGLIAAAVVTLAYAADLGGVAGTNPLFIVGMLIVSAILFVAFVMAERRISDPLIDLSLFRNRPFVTITLGGTVSNVAYAVTILATTIYLQEGRGLSPIMAGIVFLAPSVAVAISGPVAGRLASWKPVTALLPAVLALGGLGLLAVSSTDLWGLYVPLLGLTGMALGLGWTLPNIGTQAAVEPARAGEAAGVSLTTIVTVAGVGVALAGTLIELGGAGAADIEGATKGLLRGVAALSIATAIVLAVLFRRQSRDRSDRAAASAGLQGT
jgi:EmrB/QacA subfamily drug resistance transporter